MTQFLLGLVLSSSIGGLAYQRGLLSRGGVVGAIITGTLTLTAGLGWALVLIAFFVSSSTLSRIGEQRKAQAREQFSKGEQRDFWQVFANGGIGTFIAVLYLLTDEKLLWLPYIASFATMNADTWATEIGTLSRQVPRLITHFKKVEPGTSGAVTLLGTSASLAGAVFIGVIGGIVTPVAYEFLPLLLITSIAGMFGSFGDSFLGATVQALYWCPDCQKLTEKPICKDGSAAELRRGWRVFNNDVVNFSATLVGSGLVLCLGFLIF